MVDIGSRTGCILYAAHLMTKAKEIVGIEIDEEWCKIQNRVVEKFQMEGKHQDLSQQKYNENLCHVSKHRKYKIGQSISLKYIIK